MDGKVYAGTCNGVWTRQNLPAIPGVGVGGFTAAAHQLQVYPNPSAGDFSAVLNSPKAAAAVLSIHDMMGRTVWRRPETLRAGRNEMQISATAAHLPAGIYLVQVRADNQIATQRVVVQ
jgi:hypothetical protein